MGDYISRMFQQGDSEELNDLYNLVARRKREIRLFEWQWLENPEGWGSMYLILDKKKNKIIGHHGLIPIRFNFFQQELLVGKTENTVMHPDYRGKRIYFPFEKIFLEDSKKRFDLNYTISGVAEQGRIRLKLGYHVVGGYVTYLKFYSASNFKAYIIKMVTKKIPDKVKFFLPVSKLFFPFIYFFVQIISFRKNKIDRKVALRKIEDTEELAHGWDRFWEENKKYFGLTVNRSRKYLDWRIFKNPCIDYYFYLAYKENEIVGCIIIEDNHDGTAIISDIIAKENDKLIFSSILNKIEKELKNKNIGTLSFKTLYSKNSLNSYLKANGFMGLIEFKNFFSKTVQIKTSLFMIKTLNPSVDYSKCKEPGNWYFTSLFGEGLRFN